MFPLSLLVLLWMYLTRDASASGQPAVDDRMNLDKVDYEHTPTTVRFHNDLPHALQICWLPGRTFRDPCLPRQPKPGAPAAPPSQSQTSPNCVCADIPPQESHEMHTSVGSQWVIKQPDHSRPTPSHALVGKVVLFGGKHIYLLSRYLLNGTDPAAPGVFLGSEGIVKRIDWASVVHVHAPDDCTSQVSFTAFIGPA